MLKYRSDRSFIVQSCRGEAPADRGTGTSTSIQHRTHHHEQHTSILTHSTDMNPLLTYKNIHCLTFNQTMLGSFNLLALQLPHNKLSAAYSRICLAARHSHPYKQAQHDVEFLIQSYVSLGYPYKPLRAMAARMLSTRR